MSKKKLVVRTLEMSVRFEDSSSRCTESEMLELLDPILKAECRNAAVSLITAEPELLEKGSVAETIVLGNVILCENVSFSSLSAVVLCAALL